MRPRAEIVIFPGPLHVCRQLLSRPTTLITGGGAVAINMNASRHPAVHWIALFGIRFPECKLIIGSVVSLDFYRLSFDQGP
jgi:hypothetical protein